MENNFSPELIEKAKSAKSPSELLNIAKENDIELTPKEAAAYFIQINKSGELSDDELDNVSGGGCGGNDKSQNLRYLLDYPDEYKPMKKPCPKCGGQVVKYEIPGEITYICVDCAWNAGKIY